MENDNKDDFNSNYPSIQGNYNYMRNNNTNNNREYGQNFNIDTLFD